MPDKQSTISTAIVASLAMILVYAATSHWLVPAAQTPSPERAKVPPDKIENVVMIVLDGVRTEEFFIGANPYASRGPQHAKEKLFPFLWGKLGVGSAEPEQSEAATDTRFFGDRFRLRRKNRGGEDSRSTVDLCRIDNNYGISLPAYADLLGGVRQPNVRSNIFRGRLPHPTVPDRLLAHGLADEQLAVFSSWKHIASVVSQTPPVEFYVNTGRQSGDRRPRWKDARYDRDLQKAVMGYLREREKNGAGALRFLFLAYNDSDEWAHIGNYGRYLNAIRRQDAYLRELYTYLESQTEYRGKTLYIITTDHGRGRGRHWKSHGRVPGSQYIWAMLHAPGQAGQLTSLGQALAGRCSHTALGDLAYAAATGSDPDLAANQ